VTMDSLKFDSPKEWAQYAGLRCARHGELIPGHVSLFNFPSTSI